MMATDTEAAEAAEATETTGAEPAETKTDPEPEAELEPTDEDGPDFGDDDEEEPGWLVIYHDGRHQILDHPEGKEKKNILSAFETAVKKGHSFFPLGEGFVFVCGIWYFGWSEESSFPEIEQFDGLQNRLEGLIAGTAMLLERQGALQAAQVNFIETEVQLEDDEDEGEEGEEGEGSQVQAPQPDMVGRRPFAPPGTRRG